MTQSKKDDTITVTTMDGSSDTITINLDDTYGTTTSYIDTINDITFESDGTFTISDITTDTIDLSNLDLSSPTYNWITNDYVDPSEVERMCNEYPALEKVWRNFKSVYDMVKQDYEGKKKAGEIDDDIPF